MASSRALTRWRCSDLKYLDNSNAENGGHHLLPRAFPLQKPVMRPSYAKTASLR